MKSQAAVWIQALRLKFYPMSWVAYTLGALLAVGTSAFVAPVFWNGLAFLFFIEVTTVLGNEYFDFESDRANRRAGQFNGGSRVLVDGLLSHRQVLTGTAIAFAVALLAAVAVFATTRGMPVASGLMAILTILALGYTVPPLKLSYRTMGEIDVGITDSIGVLLCGYVFLGGDWHAATPWWLSLPLGLAFLPSITLCAIPDAVADRMAGKRTIAVRFGERAALRFAQVTALLAALVAAWINTSILPGSYGPLVWLSLLHAAILVGLLQKRMTELDPGTEDSVSGSIDHLMIASLSFVVWFGVLPVGMLLLNSAEML